MSGKWPLPKRPQLQVPAVVQVLNLHSDDDDDDDNDDGDDDDVDDDDVDDDGEDDDDDDDLFQFLRETH